MPAGICARDRLGLRVDQEIFFLDAELEMVYMIHPSRAIERRERAPLHHARQTAGKSGPVGRKRASTAPIPGGNGERKRPGDFGSMRGGCQRQSPRTAWTSARAATAAVSARRMRGPSARRRPAAARAAAVALVLGESAFRTDQHATASGSAAAAARRKRRHRDPSTSASSSQKTSRRSASSRRRTARIPPVRRSPAS